MQDSINIDVADLIGTPFLDLGRDQREGLDCWGVVMEVQRRMGRIVPDYSVTSCYDSEQAWGAMQGALEDGVWKPCALPRPGDVVAISTNPRMPGMIDHFGVCLGDGRFIHTIRGHNCEVAKLHDMNWQRRIRGLFRWVG